MITVGAVDSKPTGTWTWTRTPFITRSPNASNLTPNIMTYWNSWCCESYYIENRIWERYVFIGSISGSGFGDSTCEGMRTQTWAEEEVERVMQLQGTPSDAVEDSEAGIAVHRCITLRPGGLAFDPALWPVIKCGLLPRRGSAISHRQPTHLAAKKMTPSSVLKEVLGHTLQHLHWSDPCTAWIRLICVVSSPLQPQLHQESDCNWHTEPLLPQVISGLSWYSSFPSSTYHAAFPSL